MYHYFWLQCALAEKAQPAKQAALKGKRIRLIRVITQVIQKAIQITAAQKATVQDHQKAVLPRGANHHQVAPRAFLTLTEPPLLNAHTLAVTTTLQVQGIQIVVQSIRENVWNAVNI